MRIKVCLQDKLVNVSLRAGSSQAMSRFLAKLLVCEM